MKKFLSMWLYDKELDETYNIRIKKIYLDNGSRRALTSKNEILNIPSSRYIILEVVPYGYE